MDTNVVEPLPEGKEKVSWVAKPLKKPERVRWIMYLNRLVNYAARRGWKVKTDAKFDACFISEKKILVKRGKRLPETRVYALMHELGRMLLISRYGSYYDIAKENKISRSSYAYIVYGLEEEIDAWRCGLDIGESMKVPVNLHHYEMVKARYLSGLLRFLLERRVKNNSSSGTIKTQNKLPLDKAKKRAKKK